MDIRTLFIDEPSFGSGRLSVASAGDGGVHVELAMHLSSANLRPPLENGVFIVAASSTGLARLSAGWGTLLVLGVTPDPDAFVADLNACRHGDRVLWNADSFDPFDIDPGFDDHYAVAPLIGEIPVIDGLTIRDGHMWCTLPGGVGVDGFDRIFSVAMAPHEFETATRDPAVISERFADRRPLLAMPRFTEVSPGSYRRANRIYRVDPGDLVRTVAERIGAFCGPLSACRQRPVTTSGAA